MGNVNNYVTLYDSKLRSYTQTEENHQPFPTFFQEEVEIEENLYAEEYHKFGAAPINF